jgi:UDP-3-O-[3-hydroxymyristoyl] glucosamine N-acyltransferase
MGAGAGVPLGQLAQVLEATLDAHPERVVRGVASLAAAGPDDVAYVADRDYLEDARGSRAGAFIGPADLTGLPAPVLRCREPRRALAAALTLLHPPVAPAPGIDPSARVAPDARVDPTATVGPLAVIEAGASIGARAWIGPLVWIGAGVTVGEGCALFPQVAVYRGCRLGRRVIVHAGAVIGADGFGFAPGRDGPVKIPQVGTVVVEDDVEIGANSTIDRATLGETVIGRGTKIDNLVHVAHNVEVGQRCLMAAQVGIAGSSRLGNDVMIGGQAGVSDHIAVGDGAVLTAKAGVIQDVAAGERVALTWARPLGQAHRIWVAEARLPELLRAVKALERRLAALEGRADAPEGRADAPEGRADAPGRRADGRG